jgi:hypothetical protein
MASQMKSAGNDASKRPSSLNGWWNWADGMEPESNQASSTGARRRTVPWQPDSPQVQVTSST